MAREQAAKPVTVLLLNVLRLQPRTGPGGSAGKWDGDLPANGHVTESQNHRIVGVGRDLCGSSSPTLLLKQGHLQQAA